ncbi:hypothetical protein [Mucilaginibacter flavidus]|uniref:hypothetical protein n=1 Tax=Mucilaginibacter flavidus TaxID=2949309 RepID=UPI0020928013|nr:hypothetical protein [Mucilaginibacter flavidus]MCO5945965.1 hypothetical protein [Mucilaginibacter flavidus]
MNDETEINDNNLDGDDLRDGTSYIIKSEANKRLLQDAVDEMNSGVHFSHRLIEE